MVVPEREYKRRNAKLVDLAIEMTTTGRSADDATNGNVQKYVANDKPTNCSYLGVRPFN